jgi:hypothetical protein
MTMVATSATAAAHGADPVTVALTILAAAFFYAVSLFACPTRRCRTCGGTGARLTRAGRRYRSSGICRRCRGTGRTRRIGAAAIHRLWWSAVGDHLRDRRRAAHQARQPDNYPGPQPTDRRTLP